MAKQITGFEIKNFKCAKCGKPFTLLVENISCYTYKLSKGNGYHKYYCRYNCWIGDKKKVRQAFI